MKVICPIASKMGPIKKNQGTLQYIILSNLGVFNKLKYLSYFDLPYFRG